MPVDLVIAYLTRKRRGDVARREIRVEGEVIRLGRGANCQIHLPDPRMPLLHSEIRERDGLLYIETTGASRDLKLNGNGASSIRLDPGNTIDIGPYELVVGAGKGAGERRGEERARSLSVELVRPLGDDFAELSARSRISVRRVGLGKRGWSWLLFAAVMVIGLAGPLLAALDRSQGWTAAMRDQAASTALGTAVSWMGEMDWMRTADTMWNSGDMSRPHGNLAENCGACHQAAFIQVRDAACLRCHRAIEHHADPQTFQSASFAGVSCARCHKEHQGIEPIVLDNQAFCVSCHGNLRQLEPKTTLQDVTDFGAGHPEFRPTVVVDPAVPAVARMAIGGEPRPVETSNLKFPHDKHLAKDGVKHPTKGKVQIACADCHGLEPGGLGMLPISMEAHCQECHTLQFDPTAPERVLPHGKPREAVEQMREFYSKAALMGGVADPAAPASVRVRRRPGVGLSPAESAASLNWALQKAAEVATETIGKRACGNCHVVTPPGINEAGIWGLARPRIADRWMPKGRFDHAKHTQTPCVDCHAAPESKTATDVLLPGIKSCQRCHGGERAAEKVPTTCIACHDFHRRGLPPMKDVKTAGR